MSDIEEMMGLNHEENPLEEVQKDLFIEMLSGYCELRGKIQTEIKHIASHLTDLQNSFQNLINHIQEYDDKLEELQ